MSKEVSYTATGPGTYDLKRAGTVLGMAVRNDQPKAEHRFTFRSDGVELNAQTMKDLKAAVAAAFPAPAKPAAEPLPTEDDEVGGEVSNEETVLTASMMAKPPKAEPVVTPSDDDDLDLG